MKNYMKWVGVLSVVGIMQALWSPAQDVVKASLALMPGYAESQEKGVLVDFVKAIAQEANRKIDIQVVPFTRSIADVIGGQVAFHMPLIQIPGNEKGTDEFDYSEETIFHVNFVLYTAKSKAIDKSNLAGLKVATDAAHVKYFPEIKQIEPITSLEGGLKMVDAGRLDAFVFADFACDPIVKQGDMKSLKRDLYKRFDVKAVLPKNGRGGDTDKMLTAAIEKMREKKTFDKIMGVVDAPYDNWQP
jgi:polar amino acid transport system substrate-binding protein